MPGVFSPLDFLRVLSLFRAGERNARTHARGVRRFIDGVQGFRRCGKAGDAPRANAHALCLICIFLFCFCFCVGSCTRFVGLCSCFRGSSILPISFPSFTLVPRPLTHPRDFHASIFYAYPFFLSCGRAQYAYARARAQCDAFSTGLGGPVDIQ